MHPRPPDRFEELLTRAFDGEITPDERRELDSLADAEPRLVAMAELREALRAALAVPGPVDVAADVMAIIAIEDEWTLSGPLKAAFAEPVDLADAIFAGIAADAEWAPVGASLKEALRAPDIDVADAVMGAVEDDAAWPFGDELRAAVAGPVDLADAVMAGVADEAAWAPVGAALREAAGVDVDVADAVMAGIADEAAWAPVGEALREATARSADLWPGIAEGIGADPAAVHGWDEVAGPLREAFATLPPVNVADAVMAEVAPAPARRSGGGMPLWASLGGPIVAFASAAALLFAVLLPPSGPSTRPGDSSLHLASVNDAHVEEVTAAEDVVVQVMQFEDGGPTFILVDDMSGGVPL